MRLLKTMPWSSIAHSLLLAGVLLLLYFPIAAGLVNQWRNDPDYSHGFFVPLLALWILWQQRRQLSRLTPSPSWWGFAIVLGGMGLLILGALGAENFLCRVSFLFVIAGLGIQFFGWGHFRVGFFAWAVLFLMIPIPAIIANRITLPLQFLASVLASSLLDLCGVPVYREGNIIHLPLITLDVAEACSGIRSLIALTTVAVAYGYFLEQKAWRRAVLVISAIPIAVAANGLRIMGSGLLGQYWDPGKAQGFFHLLSGLVGFLFACFFFLVLHSALRHIHVGNSQEPVA